jgi:ATP-dependent DNA helicase RecG
VETYEYPKDALREAIHNAVAHKDYSGAYPIQISVYRDKIMIWNYGQLPEGWTIDTLQDKHSSQPHNPDIANAFFRIGYIEAWGRGMDKMTNQCLEANLPAPTLSARGNDFWITFRKDIYNKLDLSLLGLSDRQIKAVLYVKEHGRITNKEYQEINDISKRTAAYDLVEMVEKYKIFKQAGAGTYYEI